jgi:hypothetical protein
VKRACAILISFLSVVVVAWGASVAFNRKVDFDIVLGAVNGGLNSETQHPYGA